MDFAHLAFAIHEADAIGVVAWGQCSPFGINVLVTGYVFGNHLLSAAVAVGAIDAVGGAVG